MKFKWIVTLAFISQGVAAAEGPSFDCDKLGQNPAAAEALICEDAELASLDRQLAQVYREAREKAKNEHPPLLKAEQRGWIKGRNDCWKSSDLKSCVKDNYMLRIAELQARYRLLAERGPFSWDCGENGELIVSFFDSEPGTLIAERGDSVSLMYSERSASGAKYQGRNESFWEHQGEATVTWGYGSEPFSCKLKN